MSYQVLARKWRPRRFAELVGQEHVVRALSHALDTGRVHHAFLFTGTRGVGKTTIARIFAKSLNCERGVGADPCGECSSCKDIDAGRFIDLLEIDAASRTKVDDTREMLDNVIYAPSRGRYKVYLIDEVHMLSGHSFNALLKTLEEPPPHVKFLLATTDPQKLPVTVLSRCLQFNLKRLSEEQIGAQVKKILAAEEIAGDDESVREIARGGNGSLRDALSLLDQAIAFGNGKLVGDEVRAMLGTVDRSRLIGLVEAVITGDAQALYRQIVDVAEFAPDFAAVLDEIAGVLHRAQLAQFVPDALDAAQEPLSLRIAQELPAEEVQLLYQIAITGRRDLPLAPGPRAGFEMTLLRMLAFRPADSGETGGGGAKRTAGAAASAASATAVSAAGVASASVATPSVAMPGVAAAVPVANIATPAPHVAKSPFDMPREAPIVASRAPSAAASGATIAQAETSAEAKPARAAAPWKDVEALLADPKPDTKPAPRTRASTVDAMPPRANARAPASAASHRAENVASASASASTSRSAATTHPAPGESSSTPHEGLLDGEQWRRVLDNAALRGPARELALNVVPLGWQNGRLRLGLASKQEGLRTEGNVQRLSEALAAQFGAGLRIDFEAVEQADGALAAQIRREDSARQEAAEASIADDPVVQSLIQNFDARVVPNSTRPIARE